MRTSMRAIYDWQLSKGEVSEDPLLSHHADSSKSLHSFTFTRHHGQWTAGVGLVLTDSIST